MARKKRTLGDLLGIDRDKLNAKMDAQREKLDQAAEHHAAQAEQHRAELDRMKTDREARTPPGSCRVTCGPYGPCPRSRRRDRRISLPDCSWRRQYPQTPVNLCIFTQSDSSRRRILDSAYLCMRRVTPMTTNSVPDDNLLSIGKAARQLGVSVDTIRRWEADGKIRAIRLPSGQRRFERTEIERLLGGAA